MKPINLKFTAFGPYPKTQTIDFTALQTSNMFVITGPTGSGKTTIFDAISFALYGSASGSERKAEMFRSDFADNSALTSVEFEFQVREQTYKIKRTPSQYRPKLRGDGLRKIEPSVSLTTADKVYTAQAEVNLQIESILGLTKEQFKQIVLLPQGEFKKLLMSDSKSKEEIFRKIFNTAHLKQIQEQMRVESNGLYRKIEDAQLQISTVLKNYQHITSSHGLRRLKTAADYNLQAVEAHLQQLAADVKVHTDKLAAEQEIEKVKKSLVEYQNKLQTFAQNRDKYTLATNFLNNIKPTVEYSNYQQELAKLNTLINHNHEQLQTFIKRLETIKQSPLESQYQQAKVEYDQLEQKHLIKLELEKNLIAINQQLARQQELESYLRKLAAATQKLATNQDQKLKLEQQRREVMDNLNVVDQLQTTAQELETKSQQLTKFVTVKSEINELHTVLESNYQRAQNLNQSYNQASQQLTAMRGSYINGQAGILATTLNAGKPCPVCGSLDHPAPAIPRDQQITQEAITKQELVVQQINEEIAGLTSQIEVSKAVVIKLTSEYQIEDVDYQANLRQVEAKLASINEQITRLKVNNSLELCDRQIELCAEQLAQNRGDIKGYQFAIDKLNQEIAANFQPNREKADIESQLSELNQSIKTITVNYNTLLKQLNEQNREADNLTTNIKILQTSIQNNSDNRETINAKLQQLTTIYSEEHLQQYQTMLSDEAKIRNELEAQKSQEQIITQKIFEYQAQIASYQPIDVTSCTAELEQLTAKCDLYQSIYEQYKVLVATITNDLQQLVTIEAKNEKNIKRYQLIADVSDIANGKTLSKISFERYMLSIYFKQIITRANLYFKTMTNNRFLLEYKQPRGGRASQGLDLNIIDNYTSKVRDVKTLSGGESFKASLAMALGLSDIVQMHSGGVQIDTIFIDEGFGSLDSESLNTAIDTLIEIENEGRIVGIISHVEELKTQISNKIEIIPSQRGSEFNVTFS